MSRPWSSHLRRALPGLVAVLLAIVAGRGIGERERALEAAASAPRLGLLVESCRPLSAIAEVGLAAGDRLLSWQEEGDPVATHPLGTPFDWWALAVEVLPRTAVVLTGERHGKPQSWPLAAGLELAVDDAVLSPSLPTVLAALDRQARAALGDRNQAQAEQAWTLAAEVASERGQPRLGAWLLAGGAELAARQRNGPAADALYAAAAAALAAQQDAATAALLRRWARALFQQGDLSRALSTAEQSITAAERRASPGLDEAEGRLAAGYYLNKQSRIPAAEEQYRAALATFESLAPDSAGRLLTLSRLAGLALRRGDLAAAKATLAQAKPALPRLAPGSPIASALFTNLGVVADYSSDFPQAEAFARRSIAIDERIDPQGTEVVSGLLNLSVLTQLKGDLGETEAVLRRALAILERRGTQEMLQALVLNNLGMLSKELGDIDEAGRCFQRAADLLQVLAPDSPERALMQSNLGVIALRRDDFEGAFQAFRTAADDVARQDLRGPVASQPLIHLSLLELRRGEDLGAAERYLARAEAIHFEGQSPQDRERLLGNEIRAEIALRRGEVARARQALTDALRFTRKAFPGTTNEATILAQTARLERDHGNPHRAAELYCEATRVLDHQRTRLADSDTQRLLFSATYAEIYQDCAEALLAIGEPEAAFQAVERGRARRFLSLLRERDLRFADLPPELLAERQRLDQLFDLTQRSLLGLPAGSPEAASTIEELRDLERQREVIAQRVRAASPRLAALEDPTPLDAVGARQALDPGTLLLSFVVGKEATLLFVVAGPGSGGAAATNPAGLDAYRLPVGAAALNDSARHLRQLAEDPASSTAELDPLASELYDQLLKPAEARIAAADRLLISADGPLAGLPFAVLRHNGQYLALSKPLHRAASATVYAEVLRQRAAPSAAPLAAFGDPNYSGLRHSTLAQQDPTLTRAAANGLRLDPLPGTRSEVEGIAALFPNAEVFLGSAATEEEARRASPTSRIIHFACHAVLDERLPLNSALVLSQPAGNTRSENNGLLQAWEIFESLRLDADLVTLSACNSGLGRELSGEGMIGLTRAFQFAGARTVLASLWAVSDRSTAKLMPRFYARLRDGLPKDAALREAQRALAAEPATAHPFHWAAFELVGDWR